MTTLQLGPPKTISAASRNPELHKRVKKQAFKAGQSVSKFVERTLMEKVGIKI